MLLFVNKRFFISLVRNFVSLVFFIYTHASSDVRLHLHFSLLSWCFLKDKPKNISQKTTKLFSVNLSLVTAEDIWRHALRNTNTYTLSWRLKWKVGKNLHIYRRYLLLIYLDNIKKQKKIPSSSTYYTGIKYHISEIFFTFINTTRKTMTGSIIQKKSYSSSLLCIFYRIYWNYLQKQNNKTE